MPLFKPFRPKQKKLPVINQAVEDRNRSLAEIFDWQNPNQPNVPFQKRKKR